MIDRKFCTLDIDAVHFFQILIFCLFPAYYYSMALSDFRAIFLYEFGNHSVNERTVRRWFAKFHSGDFSFEDEPRSGRPTIIQDEDLRVHRFEWGLFRLN